MGPCSGSVTRFGNTPPVPHSHPQKEAFQKLLYRSHFVSECWPLVFLGHYYWPDAVSHASSKEDAAKFPKWEHRPFERHVSNTWHTARAGSRFPPSPNPVPFSCPYQLPRSEGNFPKVISEAKKTRHGNFLTFYQLYQPYYLHTSQSTVCF